VTVGAGGGLDPAHAKSTTEAIAASLMGRRILRGAARCGVHTAVTKLTPIFARARSKPCEDDRERYVR
jgi:hypothetical protein